MLGGLFGSSAVGSVTTYGVSRNTPLPNLDTLPWGNRLLSLDVWESLIDNHVRSLHGTCYIGITKHKHQGVVDRRILDIAVYNPATGNLVTFGIIPEYTLADYSCLLRELDVNIKIAGYCRFQRQTILRALDGSHVNWPWRPCSSNMNIDGTRDVNAFRRAALQGDIRIEGTGMGSTSLSTSIRNAKVITDGVGTIALDIHRSQSEVHAAVMAVGLSAIDL